MASRLPALAAAAAGLVLVLAGPYSGDIASTIGATHEAGCYALSTLPFLLDGAASVATLGTRLIKVALFSPQTMYPYNSQWPSFGSAKELAATPYFSALFGNEIPARGARREGDANDTARPGAAEATTTNFTDFVLVAYRVGPDPQYWRDSFTDADAQAEEAEFSELTEYLLTTYAGTGKTFLLESWENDWAIRGSYNASQSPSPSAIANCIGWHAARQAGVTAGRSAFYRRALTEWARPAPASLSSAEAARRSRVSASVRVALGVGDGADADVEPLLAHLRADPDLAVRAALAASSSVLYAAEVNLVLESMTGGFPNVVNTVLPHVELDMVSYSSYDTMTLDPGFSQALDFISAHHNRTSASPPRPLVVGEYGAPFMEWPLGQIQGMVENVVNATLVRGDVAYALWWEVYCNEDVGGGNCAEKPDPDPSHLRGFWLFLPNGTASWTQEYLKGVIANAGEGGRE